jgi:23S rRNA pseudouridine2605 synthase
VLRRRKSSTLLELTLHEGRKHQVKRICEAVGHPVRRLHRSRYAGLDIHGLKPGEWRELTSTEVAGLRRSAAL